MQTVGLIAFFALVAFGVIGFWRGLRTKPTRRSGGEFIAGASDETTVARQIGQSGGPSGGGT